MIRVQIMKLQRLAILLTSIGFSLLVSASDVFAECYGDAAAMYGCGRQVVGPRHRGGSLQRFGGRDKPILPYLKSNRTTTEDVITPRERRDMLRNIILQRGSRNQITNRAYRASVQNTGRSIRRSGGVTSRSAGIGARMRSGFWY